MEIVMVLVVDCPVTLDVALTVIVCWPASPETAETVIDPVEEMLTLPDDSVP